MTLVVLVGPAGVGKGSIVKKILELSSDYRLSVSATTRGMRPQEVDGVDYHFVTMGYFEELIENEELLEWAKVHGQNYYGTPSSELVAARESGQHLILEIDLQGARQVAQKSIDQLQIFILPPSWEELERRLRGRGTETDDEIATRLDTARQELAAADEFEHQLVNETIADTAVTILELVSEHERGS